MLRKRALMKSVFDGRLGCVSQLRQMRNSSGRLQVISQFLLRF